MARTARNTTLETAKTRRVRFVNLPISSADMSSPRPDPRPTRAPEEGAHGSQTKSNSDKPGHDPPRDGLASECLKKTFFSGTSGVREKQKSGNERRGSENRPGMEYGKKHQQEEHGDKNNSQILCWPRPDCFAFDVHVEVRNNNERDHHQRRDQNTGNEWRKKVEQFLKAEKIPRGLGGIRGKQRIRELLARRVPDQRKEHHSNHENLKSAGLAAQEMGVSHQLGAGTANYLF